MTPNLNPKTLDDLMGNARHYAEYCMRGTGNMPPTLFLIDGDGKQVMFMPENLADRCNRGRDGTGGVDEDGQAGRDC